MTDEPKKPADARPRWMKLSKWIGERLAAAGIFCTIVVFIFNHGVWLIAPRVEEKFDEMFPGVRELPVTVQKLKNKLDEIDTNAKIAKLVADHNRLRIDGLSAKQEIAQYDKNKKESFVLSPCKREQICVARFRLRRTQRGSTCQVLTAVPHVASPGAEPLPTRFEGFKPVNVTTAWSYLETPFIVPISAKIAPDTSYYVSIVYHKCDPADPERLDYESTIALRFEVIE